MLRKDLLVKIFLLAKLGNAQSGDFQDETIFDNIEVDYKGDTFNTQRSSSKNIFLESSPPEVTEEISELTETIILTDESSSGVEVFDKIIKIEEKTAIMEESSLEREPNEMLVIGLGVGIAALMLCLMLIGACVYIKKRRNEPNILSSQKPPQNLHEVQADTFERIDITRGTLPRKSKNARNNSISKKSSKSSCKTGPELPTSDLGASSMGTMKTFVNTTNQANSAANAVKAASEKNWNTSSDVDSIESKEKTKMSEMTSNRHAKVITYGYQELPTRDGSSFTTSNSSRAALEQKNPASPRQDDSVVDL